MIASEVFYARRAICLVCANWRGVCLKGHALASPVGCPERQFEPVEGAAYMADRPAAVVVGAPQPGRCCGGWAAQEVLEMTYAQAAAHFALSMRAWKDSGFAVVGAAEHDRRMGLCRSCEEHRFFQCKICRCFVLAKTKLATEACPKQKW